MKGLIILLLITASLKCFSQVKLPRLIRDSMVLQRDVPIRIWGWAQPGEKIKLNFSKKDYKVTTGKDGKWALLLAPTKAGGPFTMTIQASNYFIIKDILVGDVWVCSGQSNMFHQMELHRIRYAEDIAKADYPEIRHFETMDAPDLQGPHDDLSNGYWKSANPKDVLRFSVVAYFFARLIYEKYHIPIGLVNASVGGLPIESLTSEKGLKEFPSIMATIQKNKDTAYINGTMRKAALANAARPKPNDKGMSEQIKWYDQSYIPKNWHSFNVPGFWEDQGIRDLDGIVWFRKEVDVPASMTGIPARVNLGRIVDADMLYINGVQVGNTTYQYPQRRYSVSAGLLKAGKNLFVVRVTNNAGKGGFVPDKPYHLITGNDTIDLKGDWQYKVGDVFIRQGGERINDINIGNQPTAYYNSRIAPLVNYKIKGIIWYQGESNTGRAEEYAKLQPALIADWRNKWNQAELPFFYVQLPNFMDVNPLPSESQWAALREAQLKSLSIPYTGMAVAIDLGEWNDLHPGRKKEVGERLALAADKIAYGGNLVYSGPIYQSASIEGNKITITFNHVGSGLISNDGEELSQFAIAGADKKFVWTKAKIEGNTVVVWNDNIQDPKYVRYAWADNPDGANLYNKEGLPASPFRTDK